jgi:hypothetical protein
VLYTSRGQGCDAADWALFTANDGKRVQVGSRVVILRCGEPSLRKDRPGGEITLDFKTPPMQAAGDASPECQLRVAELFKDYA